MAVARLLEATVIAVGRPRATSPANDGPEIADVLISGGSSSSAMLLINRLVPFSSPLVPQAITAGFTGNRSNVRNTCRKAWLGTTIRKFLHIEGSSFRSIRTSNESGKGNPGRNFSLLRSADKACISSAICPHR